MVTAARTTTLPLPAETRAPAGADNYRTARQRAEALDVYGPAPIDVRTDEGREEACDLADAAIADKDPQWSRLGEALIGYHELHLSVRNALDEERRAGAAKDATIARLEAHLTEQGHALRAARELADQAGACAKTSAANEQADRDRIAKLERELHAERIAREAVELELAEQRDEAHRLAHQLGRRERIRRSLFGPRATVVDYTPDTAVVDVVDLDDEPTVVRQVSRDMLDQCAAGGAR